MAYEDFKDLTRRATSDIILCDKAFNIAKNPNMMDIRRVLLQLFLNFFGKKTSGGALKNDNMSNKELAEDLHKPIIRRFKKGKAHLSFINSISGADLADMQLVSKFIKDFVFYCVLLIFSVNTHELFLWKIKKILQLPSLFKKF